MTQSIGQKLRAEREAQKLTLEKVFEVTRIRVPYLQALEEDNLSRVPSPVQARGYLRNYAEYLGLNFEQLLDEMRLASLQQASGEVIGPADDTPTTPSTQPLNQTPEPSSAFASRPGAHSLAPPARAGVPQAQAPGSVDAAEEIGRASCRERVYLCV